MQEPTDTKLLQDRKSRIESKLKKYGIPNFEIKFLPYLQFNPNTFQSPQVVAKRALILYALAHASNGQIARYKAKKWLQKEALWESMTKTEQDFLNTLFPKQETRTNYSWSIEAAIVLNWAINNSERLSQIIEAFSLANTTSTLTSIPSIGSSTQAYISNASYRPLSEIFEENILNELVTSYFRDIYFSQEPDFTQINSALSFERHKALNWLRQFNDIKEWEYVATDT